jgi:hypothetical protein
MLMAFGYASAPFSATISRRSDDAGDIEEYIHRPFFRITKTCFDGIARIAQSDKVDSFDNLPSLTSRQGMIRLANTLKLPMPLPKSLIVRTEPFR